MVVYMCTHIKCIDASREYNKFHSKNDYFATVANGQDHHTFFRIKMREEDV